MYSSLQVGDPLRVRVYIITMLPKKRVAAILHLLVTLEEERINGYMFSFFGRLQLLLRCGCSGAWPLS